MVAADRQQQAGRPLDHDLVEGIDATEVQPQDTAVVVGAFVPVLRALRAIGARHWVLEKDASTLKPVEVAHFRPAEDFPLVVPQADVLLVTGTTPINDTLAGLLAVAKPGARTMIVGPTVTMVPDDFLARGCATLGGVRITDPEAFLDILAEGGPGYHFFGKPAEKIVLRRKQAEKATRRLHANTAALP